MGDLLKKIGVACLIAVAGAVGTAIGEAIGERWGEPDDDWEPERRHRKRKKRKGAVRPGKGGPF